ncbi:helix-turn-helix domain-containing protein [Psychroserpens sp. Hel_I_66]|uniref:helix-turn-helix domain-containing protein n=1 Tax=Psychroserpens sp. Hel_I_66 TaxID=1250004 RepID=UPI0006490B7D|nr:helix-turn-helix domain-containing protein [Psychroserpens sp. Hel_I_66]
MINITLNTHQLLDSFKKISQELDANINQTSDCSNLSFSNKFGKGSIKAIKSSNFTTYFEFDVNFNEDVYLNKVVHHDALYSTYCSKGSILCKDDYFKERILKEYTSSLYSLEKENIIEIGFAKNTHYRFSIIEIDQNMNNSLYTKVVDIFSNSKNDSNFLHLSSCNLKIAHYIDQINQLQECNLVNFLLLESLVNKILATNIKYLLEDINLKGTNTSNLSNNDLNKIKEVANSIRLNPGERYTISTLCRETTLSPSKLQEGFKLFNKTTVNEYIRNVRLLKAEKLIINEDLTISEIAYTVGINSRSYFSKIFKEKFNFSPKTYQERFSKYTNISDQLKEDFQTQY